MKQQDTPRQTQQRRGLVVLVGVWLLMAMATVVAQGIIDTAAGDGTAGDSGDNGAATAAQLNTPYGVAVDSTGNLFIADRNNDRIRKVDTAGDITTVAGTGTSGYNGDNIAATTAQLNFPFGVAVDSAGNLFIADANNNRIRKVDAAGNITTVAGNGTAGDSGDGGAATAAQLNFPTGVAVDSTGNLFIADYFNNRIRKVDATTGDITTVAGNGTRGYSGDGSAATAAQLNFPYGVAVDSAGNLFIADTGNNRIRKVDTTGNITTVAGTGTAGFNGDNIAATAAQLDFPYGVAVDSAGNLFIADSDNHRIRKVDTTGTITTVAGDGTNGYGGDGGAATAAQLNAPRGIAVDSAGNLFIADRSNHRIRKVVAPTPSGSVINPDPDMQIRAGATTAAESIISGTTINIGAFKRGEVATVDFLIRNPGAKVLEIGELVLPSFLSSAGEPLPETLDSFESALLTLDVNTSAAGALEGEFSLASNDPDEFENPFVFTVTGSVSDTPANALNILPGIDLGDISTATGEDDVVLLSFKLSVPAGSTSVTVDSLTLAANNAGIQRASNLKLYIDGGTRGELDARDVFVASTDDTEALTFTFPARTFSPNVPMWFIVVGDF